MPTAISKKIAALFATAPALTLALVSSPALADDTPASGDPGVARLAVLSGGVDVKRSDSNDVYAAAVNAPVVAGDYLTTHDDAHAEVEYTYGAALRVAPDTQIRFTRLDPDNHAVQLAQGTVELRVVRGLDAHPEVDTPGATVRPDGDGRYRVTVNDDGNTEVTARSGRVDVVTQAGTQTLAPGSSLLVTGTGDDAQFRSVEVAQFDAFDRWNDDRDAALERAHDYGYVDQGIVGADDLDQYGRWADVSGYGQVWQPSVDPGWSPYRDGRWAWEPYYGWTWVAAEPWGWAPYHYGRWFYADNAWCWYPGVGVSGPIGWNAPVYYGRPVAYAPALVAFFSFGGGGGGVGIGFGNVGWLPLAPFESYHPWWGRGYAARGWGGSNVTNITNITNNYNTYNNYGSIANYRNARVPGAALGVPSVNFAGGNFRHISPITARELTNVAPIRGVVPVVPTSHNLAFSERAPVAVRSSEIEGRFTRFAAPKIAVSPFAEQQHAVQQLAAKAYPKHASAFVRPESPTRTVRPVGFSEEPAVKAAQQHAAPAPVERTNVTQTRAGGATEARPSERTIEDRPASPWDRFGGNAAGSAPHAIVRNTVSTPSHEATARSEATSTAPQRSHTVTPTYATPSRTATYATPARTATSPSGNVHADPFSRFGSTTANGGGSVVRSHARESSPTVYDMSAPTATTHAARLSLPAYASPDNVGGAGATHVRTNASRDPSSPYGGTMYGGTITVPHRPSYAGGADAARSPSYAEPRVSHATPMRSAPEEAPRGRESAPTHADRASQQAHGPQRSR